MLNKVAEKMPPSNLRSGWHFILDVEQKGSPKNVQTYLSPLKNPALTQIQMLF